MDELDRKIIDAFPGKIVRKDLTSLMKRGANVPTFVLEYLLGMYCSTDDEEIAQQGLEKIRKILADNYVRPDESERVKSLIRERGQYTVLDKVTGRLDEYEDLYLGDFTSLDIDSFILPDEYVKDFPKILTGGIWCITKVAYDYGNDVSGTASSKKKKDPKATPFKIVSLKPIQMPGLDMEDFLSKRKDFTAEEWKSVILRSAGYEPEALTEKEKLHFIERLVPLVERNYNFCELGPRGTGKSHIYKETSPYSILISGGQTTTANLFYNLNRREVGLVGHWDCIAFDEVAGMHFKDHDAIQIMKDYMASGSFVRGKESINADASMVFEGNINDTPQEVLRRSHLFQPFPPEYNNDSAFFDRMHYYLPGWEIPKMRSDLLTGGYALITDCVSEFCKEMRKYDFTHKLDEYYELDNMNTRDETAVRKTFSGLVKLLFPDGNLTKEDVKSLLDYTIEGRRRVKEQLKIMAPAEFANTELGYTDVSTGETTVIGVPEMPETLV